MQSSTNDNLYSPEILGEKIKHTTLSSARMIKGVFPLEKKYMSAVIDQCTLDQSESPLDSTMNWFVTTANMLRVVTSRLRADLSETDCYSDVVAPKQGLGYHMDNNTKFMAWHKELADLQCDIFQLEAYITILTQVVRNLAYGFSGVYLSAYENFCLSVTEAKSYHVYEHKLHREHGQFYIITATTFVEHIMGDWHELTNDKYHVKQNKLDNMMCRLEIADHFLAKAMLMCTTVEDYQKLIKDQDTRELFARLVFSAALYGPDQQIQQVAIKFDDVFKEACNGIEYPTNWLDNVNTAWDMCENSIHHLLQSIH